MRKFFGLLAIMALAALSAAGMASASSNLADGTTITGTNSGGISLGGVITCNSSTVKADISNNAAGHGANAGITAASFTNCGSGNSVTVTSLPWTLTTTGTGPTTWTGAVDGVNVDINVGGVLCHYKGNPSGGFYDNDTELLTLSGNLALQPDSSPLCGIASPTVNGAYTLSPTLQLS